MSEKNPDKIIDVAVIGGGPAGSTAAAKLAKAGYYTVVFDKQEFPRYKTCGGGVVFRAFDFLPESLDNVIERNCFTAEVYDHQSKVHFKVERNLPIISMVMREDFDNKLLEEAKKNGAELITKTEINELISRNGYIELKTKGKIFKAKFVISADGAQSYAVKTAEKTKMLLRIPALEYEVKVDDYTFEKFRESARFDFGIIPSGYGWVFPKKEHLSIGVAAINRRVVNLNKSFYRYLSAIGIESENIVHSERHGFFIPISRKNSRFINIDKRILLAGDAAALADPVTAEGISNAILSGKLAADSIIESGLDENLVINNYYRELKKNILIEIKYARFVAALVYVSSTIRSFIFRIYGQRLCELMTDIITGKTKYTDMLRTPKNYAKLVKYLFFYLNKKLYNAEKI